MRSAASASTSAPTSVERTQTSGPRRSGSRGVTTVGADLLEPAEQAVDEAGDVRLDRRGTRLLDDADTGNPRVERRNRRRARVEPPRGPVRRIVGDRHREDVLVGEPARLRRDELLAHLAAAAT